MYYSYAVLVVLISLLQQFYALREGESWGEMTKSMLDEPNTKANGIPEARQANEDGILAGIESVETRSNAMRLAVMENLSSVILEPTPGRAWQYSRAGHLVAQNQETSVVVAKSKGTAYAICVPSKDGLWYCSIVDNGMPIKATQARL